MKRIETVRLYPTASQDAALHHALHVTRHLYNAALQQRKDAYRLRGVSVSMKMQYAEVTALRKESAHLAGVYREIEDAALRRLDLAMQAFFRRCKQGETPGFPRFKAARRWRQITYPHGDRALKFDATQHRVRIPGIGSVKLRKGRVVPPHGRAWLVCKLGRWYAQFECERAIEPLPETGHAVGLDCGVNVLLATSDGDLIANPRHVGKARLQVERAQRVVAKRKRRGKNRRKAIDTLARLHEKVARQRRDYAHKVSRALVDASDVLVLEDLRLRNMTRSAKGSFEEPGRKVAAKAGLNRALLDAGFGMIAQLIAEKAESAARSIIYVDPKYTSQTCAACGHIAKENRSGLQFVCVACLHADHADVNAAKVILQRAQKGPLASRAAVADGNDPRTMLSPSRPRLTLHDAA
ncbi:MAG TPA: transposase [Candidatus Dormibacteraeota bacterium]|nr:transposase [Candidatus Dormibacteraeota bacterium]